MLIRIEVFMSDSDHSLSNQVTLNAIVLSSFPITNGGNLFGQTCRFCLLKCMEHRTGQNTDDRLVMSDIMLPSPY